jgi:hypothetical protein
VLVKLNGKAWFRGREIGWIYDGIYGLNGQGRWTALDTYDDMRTYLKAGREVLWLVGADIVMDITGEAPTALPAPERKKYKYHYDTEGRHPRLDPTAAAYVIQLEDGREVYALPRERISALEVRSTGDVIITLVPFTGTGKDLQLEDS